jgi:hypothetical protein
MGHVVHLGASDERNGGTLFSASKLHNHLTIQCLFYFFLPVLQLLAGQVPSWLGCRAPQDHILPFYPYPLQKKCVWLVPQ